MKPPRFTYYAPTSLEEALALLRTYGTDAKLLAGGQSLVPLLNMRLLRPAVLIDLNRIAALSYIRHEHDMLAIGAMTRQRALEREEVRRHQPLLTAAAQLIGHFQIRNRGTVGGSLAFGNPAGELPALALLLSAQLLVAASDGQTRTIDADAFFVGRMKTALSPTELLIGTRFPTLPPRTGWSIQEIAQRQSGPALVGVIGLVTLDENKRCTAARLVLFGVQDVPIRVPAVETWLAGKALDQVTIEHAAALVSAHLDSFPALTDMHASAAYRQDVAAVLTQRVLAEATRRACPPVETPRRGVSGGGAGGAGISACY